MIIGIGHDISEIERISSIMSSKSGERFIKRVLTDEEQQLFKDLMGHRRIEFLAGRFTAKEAISKAFGCGIGRTLGFKDMSVVKDHAGKPICLLSPDSYLRLGYEEASLRIHLSITHERQFASSFAVIESVV